MSRLAEMCVLRIDPAARTFDESDPHFKNELQELLEVLKALDPRFMFDRNGRPGAIAAVREALPAVERELLEAVMEDCECELAATREAFFQLLRALQAGPSAARG